MKTAGFIGTGNMGSIMAEAASKSGGVRILLANRTAARAEALAGRIGAEVVSNKDAAKADYVFLGIKPQQAEAVLKELQEELSSSTHIIVSMMAGWATERIKEHACGLPVIRIMPNTPAAVGEGMMLYTASGDVPEEELSFVLGLLAPTGRISKIDEKLMDAASVITGSGPAFACMFADALADGALRMGVPKEKAVEYAAQMMIGTGKLLLGSGKHPEKLKDEVCSPAGSTIEGVAALEEGAFRAALIAAVKATCDKNGKM